MRKVIIAIDGPVGSGKSTLARGVAARMGYIYIDTGAMYRAVAMKALRRRVSLDAGDELAALPSATRIDLRQQAGAHQQDHRDRQFDHYQASAKSAPAPADRCPAAFQKPFLHI